MPEKIFGTPVAFSDYAAKEMNEIIAQGLDLGLSSYQPDALIAYESYLNDFKAGAINDLVVAIQNQTGMTLEYLRITWNEVDVSIPDSEPMFQISDMAIGFIVKTTTAGNASSILPALTSVSWWDNFASFTNPDSSFITYVLNPCPTGYHWDATSGTCKLDGCSTGYHWDTATQKCVIDTSTNCNVGTHWDDSQGKCVNNVPQPNGHGFPWVPVLAGIGIVSAVAVGGYYLYKRKKHQRTRQNNIEATQNTTSLPYR